MTTQHVWKEYAEALRRFIFSYVKNEHATNDLLQDTFLKIHTKLHSLQQEEKLKSWVFAIAKNTLLDYFKKNKQTFEVADFETASFVSLESHTEKDCLLGILKNLPKKYRDPLFLSDIKGMKQAAIATQLNLPLATVKSQIQRARVKIKEGFIACCGFSENEQGKLVGEVQEKDDCKVCR